jgi:predicted GNAT family N-acyltransferase
VEIREIAPAHVTADLISEIGRFRYRIFVEEQGLKDPYADHANRLVTDPLDETAHQITARKDGELIAVGRANIIREGEHRAATAIYHLDDFGADYRETTSLSTRLMIAPAYRGGRLTAQMMIEGLRIVSTANCDWCVALCRPDLKEFFQRMGFEPHMDHIEHPHFGDRSLMKYNIKAPRLGSSRIARMIAAAAAGKPRRTRRINPVMFGVVKQPKIAAPEPARETATGEPSKDGRLHDALS